MKIFVLLFLFLAPRFGFADILKPQDGDAFVCVDSVSGFKYELRIVDLANEEAKIQVYDAQGLAGSSYAGADAVVIESYDALNFVTIVLGLIQENIRFENYDLNSALYIDGGDSRPMSCQEL
ncbi:MAG: hypothetical protein KF767_13345 [Bdellovibrionaceae bacterium]|nr:hypothetical protein [Pseudobdellovibrionaceae bacterium]